jgi:adenylate cyclase
MPNNPIPFLILFLATSLSLGAQTRVREDKLPMELGKNWKIMFADSPDYAQVDFPDSTWTKGSVLLDIKDTLFAQFNGVAWFRLHIMVDSFSNPKPLALLMRQSGASEIYLDGKKIATYGKITLPDSCVYYNPNRLPLALPTLENGEHVLAIRYANYQLEKLNSTRQTDVTGIEVWVSDAQDEIARSWVEALLVSVACLFLVGLFFILAFLHGTIWLFNRSDSSNLYFSIFSLGFTLLFAISYMLFIETEVVTHFYLSKLIAPLVGLNFYALAWMVRSVFAKHEKWIIGILGVATIISILCKLLVPNWTVFWVTNIAIASSLYAAVFIVKGMFKKIPGAYILGIGIGLTTTFILFVTVISAVSDNVQFNTGSLFGQVLIVFLILSIVSTPMSMSVYLSWNYARTSKDLLVQLKNVKELSDKTLEQEKEKLRLISTQNEMLEQKVNERTSQLNSEKEKSDKLLLNILPTEIAEELKQTGEAKAKQFNQVSVLFTDFVNFTGLSEQMSAQELVQEIHKNFTAFDAIMEKHGIEKIKTIGDAYLAVCGLPQETEHHAKRLVQAALEIQAYMAQSNGKFKIRIGIHSGAVVAGIVGVKKFAYDIWGDTVNTASRMESTSEVGKINISETTYELIKNDFDCTPRGQIEAKGKGSIAMFFVNRSFT